jgi:5,10-methylenetetrahydrofolate reductase
MIREKIFTFQDSVTSAGNGTDLKIINTDKVVIEVTGTSTSRTILFQGLMPSGAYIPVYGLSCTDYTTRATQTTAEDCWEFNTTGILALRVRVDAVSGGNVIIKGIAVNTGA